jgi:hypothetical protein
LSQPCLDYPARWVDSAGFSAGHAPSERATVSNVGVVERGDQAGSHVEQTALARDSDDLRHSREAPSVRDREVGRVAIGWTDLRAARVRRRSDRKLGRSRSLFVASGQELSPSREAWISCNSRA